jgi:Protein of unknown function DUF58
MRLPFSFGRPAPTIAPAAAARGTGDGPLFDEALLARLGRLVLLSGRARATGVAGEHRSRRRGSSPEFADFKSYSQGDDFRRIDWNTYARLDGLFVRLSEVTTELNVHILLDASNSMDWRGDPALASKFTYARRVGGALGYIALWHFDRLVVAPFGDELAAPFGPAQGRAHTIPMLRYLELLPPLGRTNVAAVVDRYVRARRRPGVLLLLSDLLSGEPKELREALRLLRARGWQTVVVHILDEAEVTPALASRYLAADGPGAGRAPTELLEVETGERLRLTPTDGVLTRYAAAVTAWLDELETACADEHAQYIRLLTAWPFEEIVLLLLHRQGVVA